MNNYNDIITIIIPFYKNKHYLLEALKSIENQTIRPLEVIIINDGSKEILSDLELKCCDLKIVNQKNKGAAVARNKGINIARGKYIAFLDSDDLWDKFKLEYQVKVLEETNCQWSYHEYNRFYDINEIKKFKEQKISVEYKIKNVYPLILNSCPIATPSVMVKRSALIENDFRFNNNLKYGEDTCLWFDLANKYSVAIISNKLCYVRMHGDNAILNVKIQLLSKNDFWKYVMEKDELKQKIGILTKLCYKICIFDKKILNCKLMKKIPEFFLKFLIGIVYFFPWIIFKTIYKLGKERC